MAKEKNDYFKLIEEQVGYCVKAAALLAEIMEDYDPAAIDRQRQRMHEIEHQADEIHHSILSKLSVEFITPINQEDILQLVQITDDITDAIDEVVLELYMFHVVQLPEAAKAMVEAVNRCVGALHQAARELRSYKRPDTLRGLLIKVNDIESEGDQLYIQALHRLFASDADCKTLISSKAIYEGLENCCDLCEHASDVIEQIIIKNT